MNKVFVGCIAIILAANSLYAASKPNILIYFADDMGIGDTKVYSKKCPVSMPNLEKLAKKGMSFSDAHTQASLCAPSRYSILSGNYPYRGKSEGGSWNFNGGSQFLKGQKTLGDVLKKEGYRTSMFGKVHLGALIYPKDKSKGFDTYPPHGKKKKFNWKAADFTRQLKDGLSSKGFDYTFLTYGGIQDAPYAFFENDILYGKPEDLMEWDGGKYPDDNGTSIIQGWKPGFGLPSWKTHEVGPDLTQKAIGFIDKVHKDNLKNNTSNPFFIHYCSQAVHVPNTPPIDFHGKKVKGVTKGTDHMDMLYEIDVSLGIMMDELEKRGLLDDTLIIFTSDNGGLGQHITKNKFNSNEGLRGYKAQIWEGGHRVPLVISWPEKISASIWADQLVGVHDIYATICDLLKVKPGPDQGLDSTSFLSVLTQNNKSPVRQHLIHFATGKRSLRDGPWKLIADKDDYKPENLYNLDDDILEEKDLIKSPEHAKRVKQMTAKLKEIKESKRSTPVIGE